jgi:hypothetical protein
MSQTVAHLVDPPWRCRQGVLQAQTVPRTCRARARSPHVPVRQWVLSLPIPLRVLLAAQPELVTPVLQVVQRVVTRHLLAAAGLVADEGQGGAVRPIR